MGRFFNTCGILVILVVLGALWYTAVSSAPTPPPNRCLSEALYSTTPRANVEIYPFDIRVVHADGQIEHVEPLHAVQALLNPVSSVKNLQTNNGAQSGDPGWTPIYYGIVANMTSHQVMQAFWFLDRNMLTFYQCG